ncbi:endoplasmic reticulum metallopeptidase 1 isoform X1 [Fagus crenata]
MALKLRLSSGDISGFKFLFSLALMYGLMAMLVYSIIHMKFVKPLGIDAPLDRFSEDRAVKHVRVLSEEIDGRQEGRPGLLEAANYIKGQLEMIKERAGSDFRIDIDETIVNGSFNMMFLGYSISLAYRSHMNIVMRISSANSQDTDPSLLLNGHFDSPLGSPGAGDCGSCVASLLEVARLTVDSGWVPPRPIVFLFNGAEELFLLAAHGFMKTHKWRDTIGAFINVEASGSAGPDLVCQSGPGSWPSRIYAQSAVYPMAHSAAQDVFPVIPGDTDYRIFSQDYGNIPGLDIIFLLGGYFYHTSYDTIEKLLPGSIQARGDNLFSLIKAFTNSSMLQNARDRESSAATGNKYMDQAVFFDYLTWFMALSDEARFWGAFGFYAIITLAYLVAGLSGGFLTFFMSGSMLVSWVSSRMAVKSYGCQLLRSAKRERARRRKGQTLRPNGNEQRRNDKMRCSGHPHLERRVEGFGPVAFPVPPSSGGACAGGVPPEIGLEALALPTSRQLMAVVHNYYQKAPMKMNISHGGVDEDTIDHLLRHYPYNHELSNLFFQARSSILQFLLHLTVLALALSSQFFPYSNDAPKRVVFQNTFLTAGANQVVDSTYDFSVVDSNSLLFVFKYAPEVAKELHISSELSFENAMLSHRESWMALFPVSFLFSRSLKFPTRSDDVLKQYRYFPHLSVYKPHTISSKGSRRVYLELSLGSLKEVWVTVLNITGPLSSWSFADNILPAPETVIGGPPSYICRLSGASHENWTFWLEASSSEDLTVEVAVLDQNLVGAAKKLKSLFPDWVDVIAYSSFMSTYIF